MRCEFSRSVLCYDRCGTQQITTVSAGQCPYDQDKKRGDQAAYSHVQDGDRAAVEAINDGGCYSAAIIRADRTAPELRLCRRCSSVVRQESIEVTRYG